MSPSPTTLRRAFVDVCRGYSVGRATGQTVYIRHLGHSGHAGYEDVEDGFKQEAITQGAPTEVQRLETLSSKGLWSPARETEISKQRDYIARMEEGKKTIAVPSVLRGHEEAIGREKAKLNGLLLERLQVLGETAESYAARRLEDYYLVSNLFTDKDLTTPYVTFETFDTFDDDAIDAVREVYKVATEPCADGNLRHLAAQDFFMSYWILAGDDASTFYGRAVCELTYYQVRLANQGRYMKALIDNTDLSRIPLEHRNDPDALERNHTTQKNTSAIVAKGEVPVNMTPEDAKASGIQFSPLPPANLSGVELIKWMRNNRPPGAR